LLFRATREWVVTSRVHVWFQLDVVHIVRSRWSINAEILATKIRIVANIQTACAKEIKEALLRTVVVASVPCIVELTGLSLGKKQTRIGISFLSLSNISLEVIRVLTVPTVAL
jgi:hypothetical protein